MEQADDKKMIAEMKSYLSDRAKANKSADDPKAEENLPFESIDSYSTDPVGFSEMSLRMLSRVEFVFDLAAKENRFSSKYLKRCTQLEKGIKYLGSLCVTKYALQTQGQTFPQLGQLSTEKLYCMTSHHFRKLDQAVSEHMFEHQDVPDKLFDMELRYFNLLERLRSTEVKIEKFHDRYIFGPEDYSPIVHGLAFSEKSRTRSIHKQYDEAPAFRQAPAFGLLAEAHGGEAPAPNQSGEACTSRSRQSLPHVAAKSAHGTVTCDAPLPAKQVSGVSGQGSEAHGDCPHVAAKSAHGTVTCDAPFPAEQGSVISGQGSENEEVRMKNEDGVRSRTCEGSDSGANCTAETGTVTRQRNCPPAIARESVISGQGSVNEEGRMKKEDGVRSRQGSDSGANCSKSLEEEEKKVSGVSDQGSVNEEGRMKNEETLPPCLEIMKRVMERSRNSDDHSLTFTFDEMEFLASDPLFARLDPRLASDIRKILEKGPPG